MVQQAINLRLLSCIVPVDYKIEETPLRLGCAAGVLDADARGRNEFQEGTHDIFDGGGSISTLLN